MHIVLLEPEIPGNTGNIGRTCVATATPLHLIEPLGFRLDEKEIRRAGLDYWPHLQLRTHADLEAFRTFFETYADKRVEEMRAARGASGQADGAASANVRRPVLWMATTKARRSYTDVSYGPDDFLMFGKESAGIPEEVLVQDEEHCIRIPMVPDNRSLNLSNSVAIVLYEALRQDHFRGLETAGALHRLQWPC